MGVEKLASCKLPMLVDKAITFSDCSEFVNRSGPPERSRESLPRYSSGPEVGKEKAFQFVVLFKERSGEVRLPVKAAEEEDGGREVGVSVEGNSAKSQLIDWLP